MDFHFLLRNGISGGVLLLMFIVGLQIADGDELRRLYKFWEPLQGSSAILIAATPILGILLQGVYLICLYRVGHIFSDDARSLVAERFRSIVEKHSAWPGRFKRPLQFYYDDPIFVAFYHSHAPSHLIEWARRRRSYHYLGWTASIGAVSGLMLGFVWSNAPLSAIFVKMSTVPWVIFTFFLIVAVISALYLATRMLRDADQMEAAWTVAYLDPLVGEPIKLMFK